MTSDREIKLNKEEREELPTIKSYPKSHRIISQFIKNKHEKERLKRVVACEEITDDIYI
jgi:hypothetical protein